MSERGLADSLQWAVLVPALLGLVLGTIQTGIWLHGRTVASDAALAAAEEVAWSRSTDAEARAVAEGIAADGGVVGVSVSIDRTGALVEVRVSGRVTTFFDVGQGRLSEVAVLPLERATRP